MRINRQTLWEQLLQLPDNPALPLQVRLRAAVVREILAGRLAPGAPLPSSRDLARVLGLGRNTVTAAYRQLVDEGFLQARARSGVFVAEHRRAQLPTPASGGAVRAHAPALAHPHALANAQALADAQTQANAHPLSRGPAPDWPARMRRSARALPSFSKPERWRDYRYPFVYGGHDPQLFPTENFRECCSHSLARSQLAHWAPDFENEDVPDLIEQIRQRLLPKRGVFALPEEIVVTVGAQQAFHLLADALFDSSTRVAFEDPGYPHARNSFALRQPQWVPLAVDGQGAVLDPLPRGAAAPHYLFVSPSHQCPTTVQMSLERRHALLQRAQEDNFVVIEDDYESENLYAGTPMPALKSLDRSDRVVYVGSLSKSLAPAVRLGYIVAPRALAAELRGLRHLMVRHPSAFLQHAYALFVSLGHHESHARRVNQAMQERMQLAAQGLRRHLPDCRFTLPQGGASLWVQMPDGQDGLRLADAARALGVLIEPGAVFFQQPARPCPFFRLRLSSIAPGLIDEGLQALAQALRSL